MGERRKGGENKNEKEKEEGRRRNKRDKERQALRESESYSVGQHSGGLCCASLLCRSDCVC